MYTNPNKIPGRYDEKEDKINYFLKESLLTEKQQVPVQLRIDADGTDLEEFKRLRNIADHADIFVKQAENLYLWSSTVGCGKAQPDEAAILTASGYTKMKDIAVGTKLYGEDGLLHTVIGKYDRGTKDVYRVTFQDGTSTECCDEHLWTVYDHETCKNITLELKNIINNLHCSSKAKNRTKARWRYSIPVTSPVQFNKKTDLKIKPYLLGYLLDGGCFHFDGEPSFSCSDEDAGEICGNIKENLDPDYTVVKENNRGYAIKNSHIDADGQGIASKNTLAGKNNFLNKYKAALYRYNLLSCHSWDKFIPEDYKFSSIEDRIELIRGLLDSGGSAYKQIKGGAFTSYSTYSEQLANDFAFIIQSLGGTCSIRRRKPKSYIYKNEKRYGRIWYNLAIKMPSGSKNIFSLRRKAMVFSYEQKHQRRELYRTIIKVDYIGKKHCYCIMTDNPTHLYLTDNLIVTHNTSWCIKILLSYFVRSWRGPFTCRGMFVSVPKFLLAIKSNITEKNEYYEKVIKNINTCPLVIWDDMAAHTKNSEFELNQLFSIIDNRLNAGLSNIYTSNLSPKELTNALGNRLASRICNTAIEIQLKGQDKRCLALGGNN